VKDLRLLILAGTGDAAQLASRLAEVPKLTATISFAGRVAAPTLPPGACVRIGGFGGVEGLIAYLTSENIDALIDATHPFAERMHHNAATACGRLSLPILAFTRPAWEPPDDEPWHEVNDIPTAAALAPFLGRRIFLTIGRQELAPFAAHREPWFLIRSIDEPKITLPPNHELLLQRGPFAFEEELAVMREHSIDLLISKNSGGSATFAKIAAARALGIPILMVRRPPRPQIPSAETLEETLTWLTSL
jgi:precorrin-6A/cobalt-precorrin-6A reductase